MKHTNRKCSFCRDPLPLMIMKYQVKLYLSLSEIRQETIDASFAFVCRLGDINAVQRYLPHVQNIRAQDILGITGLFNACKMGYLQIAALLIQHGADVNQVHIGIAPLYISANNGHFEIVKLLLEHNADVMYANAGHGTALLASAAKSQLKILHLLRWYVKAKTNEHEQLFLNYLSKEHPDEFNHTNSYFTFIV